MEAYFVVHCNGTPAGPRYPTEELAEKVAVFLRRHCDPRNLYEVRPIKRGAIS